MNSTLNPTATDANNVLIARADERLAHAYAQIAQADEELVRVTEHLSKLEQDGARHISGGPGRLPSRDRPARRGLIGLLLAACIFVAAFALHSSYGDAVRPTIVRWAPPLVPTSSQLLEKPGLSAQPSPASVQAAAAEPIPPQPTPSAQTAPQDIAPTMAPVSPEVAQLLQTIVRDLANLEQRIDQLKTGQDQMASDNAKAVEQLKASQEQMARLIAKASERNPPPKI